MDYSRGSFSMPATATFPQFGDGAIPTSTDPRFQANYGSETPVPGDLQRDVLMRKSCDYCHSRKKKCDGDGVNPCRCVAIYALPPVFQCSTHDVAPGHL